MGLMVKVPTAVLVVSKAEPVSVGLVTVTELAALPVKVILWVLGPNVIWAACAPDAQRSGPATSATAVRRFLYIFDSPTKNCSWNHMSKYRANVIYSCNSVS